MIGANISSVLQWPGGNQALSGRIIRLVVTCSVSSFTRCVLLKAKGTVTCKTLKSLGSAVNRTTPLRITSFSPSDQ